MKNVAIQSPDTFPKSAWAWLCTAEAERWIEWTCQQSNRSLAENWVKRLGRELSPVLSRLIVEQSKLRCRAARKFSVPKDWLWSSTLLEQSSDEQVSQLSASYFPRNVDVLDLCCGAGCDAVALAKNQSHVIAVDHDWLACFLTTHNLSSNRVNGEVRLQNVHEVPITPNCWIHADPDRRTNGRRSTNVEFLSPNIETILRWINCSAGGSIKLAPVSRSSLQETHSIAKQWIGWGGSVRQQRWWWGIDDFPSNSKTASILDSNGVWQHFQVNRVDYDESASIDSLDQIGDAIGDCDPSIRASNLTIPLAQQLGAITVGSAHGYITSSDPKFNPFVHWFKVRDVIPMDNKKLRRLLAANNIGTLEIKTRGVDIQPEILRKTLKLSGDQQTTLLITRIGNRTVAIMADRIANTIIQQPI